MIDVNDDLASTAKVFKVCFVTGMWQRHDVFEMFAEGVKYLQDNLPIDIHCCVAGSEFGKSRDLVLKYHNFHYMEIHNSPLCNKMNQAVQLARTLNPDYCLMLGSDDLIGLNLMRRYIEVMKSGIDFAYITDCYFFDVQSKKGLYWGGYIKPNNKGDAAGIGKLISKNLLDKIDWNCFPPGFDRILDTGFDKQLRNVKHSRQAINLKKEGLFALDIKSKTNMTPFAQWLNSEYMDGKRILFDNLPEHLAKKIYGS